MTCPDANRLQEYAEGLLDPATYAAVREHIATCPTCSVEVEVAADDPDTIMDRRPSDRTADAFAAALLESVQNRWVLQGGERVDRYEIVRPLGRGGMSEVYLARDLKLGRRVALKLLEGVDMNAELAARFDREARVMAKLDHPNIVSLFDVGEHGQRPYLVLEYVPGKTLRELLADKKRIAPSEVAHVGRALFGALAAAHAGGVLHRDLKPENVVQAEDGRVRVLDFGLAKLLDDGEGTPDVMTSAGTLVGSPPYLSPERWRGEPATEASDVWSLGVMFHELLVGARPFDRKTLLALATEPRAATVRLPAEIELPDALRELVDACLDPTPAKRPSVAELVRRIAKVRVGSAELRRLPGPFVGTRAYETKEAPLYFGRDADVATTLERLESSPLVTVVGPPGSGKTSFVEAGVLARLAGRERWMVLRMRPGGHPFLAQAVRLGAGGQSIDVEVTGPSEEFSDTTDTKGVDTEAESSGEVAQALKSSPDLLGARLVQIADDENARVMLFVDQLEELLKAGETSVASRFLESICLAATETDDRIRVVVATRDAAMGTLSELAAPYGGLGHVVGLSQPAGAQLREMFDGPASLLGFEWEDGLLDRMIEDVADAPAPLPLLQLAAKQLAQRDKTITKRAYDDAGGVVGLLATHAERVVKSFGSTQRVVARRVLVQLAQHRFVERGALQAFGSADAELLVARLVDARVIVERRLGDGGTVVFELAHPKLATAWPRLAEWIAPTRKAAASSPLRAIALWVAGALVVGAAGALVATRVFQITDAREAEARTLRAAAARLADEGERQLAIEVARLAEERSGALESRILVSSLLEENMSPGEDPNKRCAGGRATAMGCVRITDAGVQLDDRPIQSGPAIAAGASEDRIAVAGPKVIRVFDKKGAELSAMPIAAGVTGVAVGRNVVVAGYADGHVTWVTSAGERPLVLAGVGTGAVTALACEGYLAAGFADGTVGVWMRDGGERLAKLDASSSVVDLRWDEGVLVVTSEERTIRWTVLP